MEWLLIGLSIVLLFMVIVGAALLRQCWNIFRDRFINK